MKDLLAVSVAPESTRTPHPRSIALLSIATSAAVTTTDDGWLSHTPAEGADIFDDPERGFTVRLTRSTRSRVSDLGAHDLAAMLNDGGALDGEGLAGLLPPFAAAHWAGPGRPVVVAVASDRPRQVYWWARGGLAPVPTTAPGLAAPAGGRPQAAAIPGP